MGEWAAVWGKFGGSVGGKQPRKWEWCFNIQLLLVPLTSWDVVREPCTLRMSSSSDVRAAGTSLASSLEPLGWGVLPSKHILQSWQTWARQCPFSELTEWVVQVIWQCYLADDCIENGAKKELIWEGSRNFWDCWDEHFRLLLYWFIVCWDLYKPLTRSKGSLKKKPKNDSLDAFILGVRGGGAGKGKNN